MKRNKKLLYLICIVLVLLITIVGWFYFNPSSQREPVGKEREGEEELVPAKYATTYDKNGIVELYDLETGKKLDAVDLREQASQKERMLSVTEPSIVSEPEMVRKPSVSETFKKKELIEGYEPVSLKISKGESVWQIQSDLTPSVNVIHLLPLLKEVNKGKSLHPVYPNETRIFLKVNSKQGKSNTSSNLAPPITQTKFKSTKPKKVKMKIDESYIFNVNVKKKALYAYSDVTEKIYKLTVEKDKWNVETAYTLNSEMDADWLFVDEERVWLSDISHSQIEAFSTKDSKRIKAWATKGVMSKWHIDKDVLTYTYSNRMNAESLHEGNLADVVIGDSTLDFAFVQNRFYVLNSFGKKTNNSILLKIHPETLRVDDLIELKSKDTAILSHGAEGHVYIGKIESTKGLDGEILQEPKVVSMDVTSDALSEDLMNWELVFSRSMQGWNDYLYAIEDGKLRTYKTGESKPVKEFDINLSQFNLLP